MSYTYMQVGESGKCKYTHAHWRIHAHTRFQKETCTTSEISQRAREESSTHTWTRQLYFHLPNHPVERDIGETISNVHWSS